MSIPKAPIANMTELPDRKPNVDRSPEQERLLNKLKSIESDVDTIERKPSFNFWHWLGFHKWAKWSEPKEKSPNLADAMTGQTIWYQSRYCEVCNIYERRLVK